jgi:N-acetyl-anhydromuramyl-L-alanine amidase AmpD
MSKVNHIGDANGMVSDSKGGEFETFKNKTMSKQTAVEWLVEQLKLEGYDYTVEQAKEMEKEQIIESYNESFRLRDNPYAIAEKYYKQTYGGNK